MDYSETRNLSRLGGSIKTSITQGLPAMSHILNQNLHTFSSRWLHLLGMWYRGTISVKLYVLLGGTNISLYHGLW